MPCSSMLVVQSRCGSGFFSTPWMEACSFCVLGAGFFTSFLRMCSMVQVRKPPVPQAGSSTVSPSLRIDHVDHELGDGSRACSTRRRCRPIAGL